jgi:molybdenum cofactor biosynthesis protein B
MSVTAHRAEAHPSVPCFVLTVSDTRTLDTETSGRAIAEGLLAAGHTVVDRLIEKDDPASVRRIVEAELDRQRARAIITTGGTGLAGRDSTYEALVPLLEKRIDGFGELFRMLSFQEIGSAAMMSRAAAGIVRGTALFLLPGSEAAVRLAMRRLIIPELGHISRELTK